MATDSWHSCIKLPRGEEPPEVSGQQTPKEAEKNLICVFPIIVQPLLAVIHSLTTSQCLFRRVLILRAYNREDVDESFYLPCTLLFSANT